MPKYLESSLEEVQTESEVENLINTNEKVIISCGRNGPMCLPVYGAFEVLKEKENYLDIKFVVMPFDVPGASIIRELPECQLFMGLPFTIYYKNGKVVGATSSIQDVKSIKAKINECF
ncbi:MAG: thioredoxin [Candidatus Lokiarchaeota archaeon]|nr:thioredoxin [Candidatus Lokiarchaeota archaeon]